MNSASTRQGYLLAAVSVLLVTLAQLLMKWGVSQVPALTEQPLAVQFWWDARVALLWVTGGIVAYLLSMACWLQALTILPLNKAYPMLSISYALVYVATITLPWFHELFSLSQCLGVTSISCGVLLIVSSPSEKANRR